MAPAQVTPRGVQLVLGSAAQPNLVDTLVMANLAYFQLKASPGAFHLALAPGRSRQLYTIDDPGAPAQVASDLPSSMHLSPGAANRMRACAPTRQEIWSDPLPRESRP